MRKFAELWIALKTNRFALLLVSLVLQLLVPILVVNEVLSDVFSYLFVSLTLVVSILIFYRNHKPKLLIAVSLGVLGILLINWIDYFGSGFSFLGLGRVILLMLIYVFIFMNIFREFKRRGEVTIDFIYGAISGYLIIGIIGAFLSFIIESIYPGAFSFVSSAIDFRNFIYFSFVTITTLGYGDVLPINDQGEILAIFLAVVGQLYLTIIIALIIGQYLAKPQKRS